MLFGIFDNLLRRLQAAQNDAARLVTGTRRREHINARFEATSLVASATAHRIQAGSFGVQSDE